MQSDNVTICPKKKKGKKATILIFCTCFCTLKWKVKSGCQQLQTRHILADALEQLINFFTRAISTRCISFLSYFLNSSECKWLYSQPAKLRSLHISEPNVTSQQSAVSPCSRGKYNKHFFDLRETVPSILLRISTGLDSALTGAAAVTFWQVFFSIYIYICAVVPHLSLVWLMLISGRLVFPRCGEPSGSRSCVNHSAQRARYEATQTRPWPTSSALFI